jgi:hypothetical protein
LKKMNLKRNPEKTGRKPRNLKKHERYCSQMKSANMKQNFCHYMLCHENIGRVSGDSVSKYMEGVTLKVVPYIPSLTQFHEQPRCFLGKMAQCSISQDR